MINDEQILELIKSAAQQTVISQSLAEKLADLQQELRTRDAAHVERTQGLEKRLVERLDTVDKRLREVEKLAAKAGGILLLAGMVLAGIYQLAKDSKWLERVLS